MSSNSSSSHRQTRQSKNCLIGFPWLTKLHVQRNNMAVETFYVDFIDVDADRSQNASVSSCCQPKKQHSLRTNGFKPAVATAFMITTNTKMMETFIASLAW